MYTKDQVDDMLFQVEQEFNNALGSIAKNEDTEEVVEVEEVQEEVAMAKSEEASEEENYETIDELYASMSKSEIEAHYDSVKRVIFNEEVEEETVQKSEEVEEVSMAKSEKNAYESQIEGLQKNLDQYNELLTKIFNKKKAPSQKAITSTNYIAKSEETEQESGIDFSNMSKSEVTSKLNSLDYAGLEKSDREAINEYCLNNASVDKVKHLIKE
jgi:hypothetical protein